MSPRTLLITILLLDVRSHITFTLRRLRKHPLTKDLPLTGIFAQLLVKWSVIHQQELDLADQIDDSSIEVATTDHPLDIFAQRTSSSILMLTQNNRASALYLHFFGGKPLHAFIRPMLSDQLEAMEKWIPSLTQSEHPSLVALGAELPELIEKASQAAAAKSKAEQQRKDFREVGDRKKYIDEVNSARKEGHGVLCTLPHKYPGLPSNFGDQFFRRDRIKSEPEVTIETLREDIAALQSELTNKEALCQEMSDAEAKAAQKAAEESAAREAAKNELDIIARDLAAKQKRADELKAIIEA